MYTNTVVVTVTHTHTHSYAVWPRQMLSSRRRHWCTPRCFCNCSFPQLLSNAKDSQQRISPKCYALTLHSPHALSESARLIWQLSAGLQLTYSLLNTVDSTVMQHYKHTFLSNVTLRVSSALSRSIPCLSPSIQWRQMCAVNSQLTAESQTESLLYYTRFFFA